MARKNNTNSEAKVEQLNEELVKAEQPEEAEAKAEQPEEEAEAKAEQPEEEAEAKADPPDEETKPPEENQIKQVTILAPNVNFSGVIGGISFTSGKASLVPDNDPKANRMISWFRENGYSVTFS